jgi:hypothetical protein
VVLGSRLGFAVLIVLLQVCCSCFGGLGRLSVPKLLCRAAVFSGFVFIFLVYWLLPGAAVLVLGVAYCIHLSTFMYFLVIKF